MTPEESAKLPRLYIAADLALNAALPLDTAQAHYLRTVLRREAGDAVRLFNGRDGEFAAKLEMPDKKAVAVRPYQQLKAQTPQSRETHLIFAPLKKDALDFLVEKAVELGVTHFHPVLTQNTEARRLNEDRVRQQIIEAVEQCERLTLPELLPLEELSRKLAGWDINKEIYAGIERAGAPSLDIKPFIDVAFLIGPEGGFTAAEKADLARRPFVTPVSLGDNILRAETAALFCLALRARD